LTSDLSIPERTGERLLGGELRGKNNLPTKRWLRGQDKPKKKSQKFTIRDTRRGLWERRARNATRGSNKVETRNLLPKRKHSKERELARGAEY